ncbi:7-deoxyloganetin glucosyltransferase, partial [Mucuna pruriens]
MQVLIPFLFLSPPAPFTAEEKLKMTYSATRKPHAVLTPLPFQGHINPMFQLAKLLHLKGFHITFVHTEDSNKRLIQSRGPHALDGLQDFCFETIPNGHGDADVAQDILSLCESTKEDLLLRFCDLLARLNDSATKGLVPPVTCLVSECSMTFTIQAAQQLALPILLFQPSSACSFLSFLHFPALLHEGVIPLKDESYLTNGYLDTKVDWIPGMKNFRLKDLPDFIRTTDPNNFMVKFVIEMTNNMHKASAIAFNTSDKLESDVLNALSSMFPSLYPIGPFPSFLNQSPQKNHLASLGSNLRKEDTECLEWLESKEAKSVVYVNFGMSPEQLLEFAWGLANSKRSFLWIIRPDLVIGGSSILSSEFVNETSNRGLIASWCPQEQVLNHPSVGGFLTHCGWNSTIESICAGVPMLCWPYVGEQPTNCRYICNEWDIGVEIDINVKREEVEKLVNELMVGEKGKKMREKVMEMKKKADEDTRPGGRSYMNLDKTGTIGKQRAIVVAAAYVQMLPLEQTHQRTNSMLQMAIPGSGEGIQELALVLSKQRFSNVRGTNPLITTLYGPQYNFSLMKGTNS